MMSAKRVGDTRFGRDATLVSAFPTLVHLFDAPVLVERRDEIVRQVDTRRSLRNGLTDGVGPADQPEPEWISTTDWHLLGEPILDELAALARSACETVARLEKWDVGALVLTELWGVISSAGNVHLPHGHANSFLSGVMYPSVPRDGGRIVFHDPRPTGNAITVGHDVSDADNAKTLRIEPYDGLVLVFPSWLPHSISRNENPDGADRVSLAFNALPTGEFGGRTGRFRWSDPTVPPAG